MSFPVLQGNPNPQPAQSTLLSASFTKFCHSDQPRTAPTLSHTEWEASVQKLLARNHSKLNDNGLFKASSSAAPRVLSGRYKVWQELFSVNVATEGDVKVQDDSW